MNKILCLFFIFLFMFSFVGCKTFNQKEISKNEIIASEISQIENIESFSDETIKTLSVLFRTSFDSIKHKNFYVTNDRILSLVKSTKDEKLKNQINFNVSNKTWTEIISKAELLEFFNKKEIFLSTLSSFEILKDTYNNASHILVASKKIPYTEFGKYFKLPSNSNINIENHCNYIKISGYGKGYDNVVDIEKIEELSKQEKNYLDILKTL